MTTLETIHNILNKLEFHFKNGLCFEAHYTLKRGRNLFYYYYQKV
ncbi:hypothetical protein SBF1_260022 [Candidatus Desulfosporosinus infrequens]|uniref:Uncharacterized protein n=1 Tax=Candidatus Desulfosporosinus infrequens TaxID=2043169 RepID=A0A2U3KQX1_9FIRM|nr:hypothetical protein SBF1_260022 [Candidatus Desulfosporosinus infrequens]